MIRTMRAEDLKAVVIIYQQGMDTGMATFELRAPSENDWDQKFNSVLRYVYEEQEKILGWVSLTPISNRHCYRGVGEVSVYVTQRAAGKGIATQLLRHLEQAAREQGYWMLQSSIFEINEASIRLHEKCGFRRVGIREKIAMRDGLWHNTLIMEKRICDKD